MAYETVRMEPNDALKFYYQRFKALKTGYEDTMRALGVMPEPRTHEHHQLIQYILQNQR